MHSPGAIRVNNYGQTRRLSNTLIKNNFFSRNGKEDVAGNHIDNQQIVMARAEGSGLEARRNMFYTADEEQPHFRQRWSDSDHFGSGNLIEISETESWSGWRDNMVLDEAGLPGLEIYDYRKADSSPLIDGGEALTETTSSGSGTTVPVEDGYYFYDGWADGTREGDRVQIGDEIARVVNRNGGELELDRSISWDNGDPVGLPWAGSSPDIGPYESGQGGRKHVVVFSDVQMVQRGESIAFGAEPRNIDAQEICWQMGDGTGNCDAGTQVEHTYDQEGGKGVRVRVQDSDGNYHWGTRFVMVKEPGREDLYGSGDAFNEPTYDSDENFETTNIPGIHVKLMDQMCDSRGSPGVELNYEEGVGKGDSGWDCGGTSIYN